MLNFAPFFISDEKNGTYHLYIIIIYFKLKVMEGFFIEVVFSTNFHNIAPQLYSFLHYFQQSRGNLA